MLPGAVLLPTGFIPTLEFAEAEQAYTKDVFTVRMGNGEPGYYDNRCTFN